MVSLFFVSIPLLVYQLPQVGTLFVLFRVYLQHFDSAWHVVDAHWICQMGEWI